MVALIPRRRISDKTRLTPRDQARRLARGTPFQWEIKLRSVLPGAVLDNPAFAMAVTPVFFSKHLGNTEKAIKIAEILKTMDIPLSGTERDQVGTFVQMHLGQRKTPVKTEFKRRRTDAGMVMPGRRPTGSEIEGYVQMLDMNMPSLGLNNPGNPMADKVREILGNRHLNFSEHNGAIAEVIRGALKRLSPKEKFQASLLLDLMAARRKNL
jgi:hypothetical protein